ncbi:MAG TPA: DUF488 domain-containing protein, partial [Candidatus Saccharimonadaceae bacterium]|nr:DUF488 domain-containing protein [Candidatus Saccharimonadaceae bacterium]
MRLYTIGHSTRSLMELVEALKAYGVSNLIDVRTVPKSRHTPQFNEDNMAIELPKSGITYEHRKALGGLRYSPKGSINLGWHNTSFRGYADYMQTPEFAQGLGKLLACARRRRVAIMCAEAVPWRCHRSLIADALQVRRCKVEHIVSGKTCQEHTLTAWAKVQGTKITYPSEA